MIFTIQRIMADCIANLFEKVDKEEMAEQDISLDKEPVYGTQFKDLIRFDRTNAEDFAAGIFFFASSLARFFNFRA